MTRRRLTFVLPSLQGGGAERCNLLLAKQACAVGHAVAILTLQPQVDYPLPEGVELVCLNARRTAAAIKALRTYLFKAKPDWIISALTHINLAVLLATMPRWPGRILLQEHFQLENRPGKDRLLLKAALPLYARAQAVVAVNAHMRQQLQQQSKHSQVIYIAPPLDLKAIKQAARKAPAHSWLQEPRDGFILLAAARLEPVKDYPTLLQALALARKQMPIRLIVLGQGSQQESLSSLSRQLGLGDSVAWAGFSDNPFAAMARADLLVLSSRSESYGLAVAEALACGCNVAATACGSGITELLDQGRLGSLATVGNAQSLAEAIIQRLQNPLPAQQLSDAVSRNDLPLVWQQYQNIMDTS